MPVVTLALSTDQESKGVRQRIGGGCRLGARDDLGLEVHLDSGESALYGNSIYVLLCLLMLLCVFQQCVFKLLEHVLEVDHIIPSFITAMET